MFLITDNVAPMESDSMRMPEYSQRRHPDYLAWYTPVAPVHTAFHQRRHSVGQRVGGEATGTTAPYRLAPTLKCGLARFFGHVHVHEQVHGKRREKEKNKD